MKDPKDEARSQYAAWIQWPVDQLASSLLKFVGPQTASRCRWTFKVVDGGASTVHFFPAEGKA